MVAISVICPVYNAENFLRRCVDSVLSQTFLDFELLLINDGSVDNSRYICDEYKKKDPRVKVFHKENEGISATREFGIKKSTGIFVQFVDSDDWIDKNMLEVMYNKAVSSNSQIVACNFIQEYGHKSIKTNAISLNIGSFTRAIISNYWGVLWKLLIRRDLFVKYDIHFPEGINGGEDYFVVTNLLINCEYLSFVDFYPYHYIRNNCNSFISTPTYEKLMYQVNATRAVEELLKHKNLLLMYEKELNIRKCCVKADIMRVSFLKGTNIFPELNVREIISAPGLYNKILLIVAYLKNRM